MQVMKDLENSHRVFNNRSAGMNPWYEKTLTIAIPTFNGEKYIGIAINSILDQIRDNPVLMLKTEILVSDNASQDKVGEIAGEFLKRFPDQFRYYRNEENVGFDRNVDLAVRRASSEFVWVLADDDFLLEGAVDHVQNAIAGFNGQKVALMFVNYSNPVTLKIRNDELCHDGNVFFRKTRFKSGLISCNIFSRSVWMTSHVERFFDSGWVHFGYDLEALNPPKGNKSYIVAGEFLKTGGEMKWGKGGTFIYYGFRLVEIFSLMPGWGYDRKTKRMAYNTIKGGYPVLIPLAKAQGLKMDFALLKRFYSLYRHFPSFWVVDLPLLIIPNKICYFAYRLFKSIKGLFKRNV
jgi:abequosyltransferase